MTDKFTRLHRLVNQHMQSADRTVAVELLIAARDEHAAMLEALREVFDEDAGHPSAETAVKMRTIAMGALAKVGETP